MPESGKHLLIESSIDFYLNENKKIKITVSGNGCCHEFIIDAFELKHRIAYLLKDID